MSGARRLGRYEVGERLGSGGLGEVYLAHVEGARGFRKRVVVKQIRRELAARPEVTALLRAEAEVVQQLAHGNIVQVLDFGVEDGQAFLVMEHVDGVSLAALLADARARAELDAAAALCVVEAVCAALAHAHAPRADGPRLVHRDVTPANILVSRDGVVKLTDFGIASLIATAAEAGTPGYAAPEQRAGRAVDERADVYALGVVLGELLTAGASGDAALRAIAARAAAPEREDRFASAEALAEALERWRAERGVLRAAPGLAAAVRGLQARRGRLADGVEASLGQRRRDAVTAALVPEPRRRGRWLGLAGAAAGLGLLVWLMLRVVEEGATTTGPDEAAGAEVVDEAPRAAAPGVVKEEDVAEAPEGSAGAPAASEPPPAPAASKPRGKPRPQPAAKGRLLVNLVPWAEASIDGRVLGRTPFSVDLAPGRYTMVLVNPELGQRRTREVAIAGGAETRVTDW